MEELATMVITSVNTVCSTISMSGEAINDNIPSVATGESSEDSGTIVIDVLLDMVDESPRGSFINLNSEGPSSSNDSSLFFYRLHRES